MRYNFLNAIDLVLKYEGLYSNDPDDPGQETVFGISRKHWPDWQGWTQVDNLKLHFGSLKAGLENDQYKLYNSFISQVHKFYLENFWDKIDKDLPSGIDIFMFDMAINQGVDKAIKALQYAVGEKQDGILGPKTLNALHVRYPENVLKCIFSRRIFFYMNTSEKLEAKYGQGWANRAVDVFLYCQEEI